MQCRPHFYITTQTVCTTTEDGKRLEISNLLSRGIVLSISENKGADQLHIYCAADLCLCLRICKRFSHDTAHIVKLGSSVYTIHRLQILLRTIRYIKVYLNYRFATINIKIITFSGRAGACCICKATPIGTKW